MKSDPPSKRRSLLGAIATQGGIGLFAVGASLFAGAAFGPAAIVPAILLSFALPSGAVLYRQSRQLDTWEKRLEPKKIAAITPSSQSTWSQAEQMLFDARRKIGRKSSMYRPLDRIVRAVRKLEKRMIDEPDARKILSRTLRRRVPLIAETAARYANLSLFRADENQNRLHAAEGLLRRSADTLTRLSKADVNANDFIRLDVDSEILGEHMNADIESLTASAAALHGAHHLTLIAADVDKEMREIFEQAAERLERIAGYVDAGRGATEAARPFLEDELHTLLETADLYSDVRSLTEDSDHEGLVSGRDKLRAALENLAAIEQACIDSAIAGFENRAARLEADPTPQPT